jgi:hypothetical protein
MAVGGSRREFVDLEADFAAQATAAIMLGHESRSRLFSENAILTVYSAT